MHDFLQIICQSCADGNRARQEADNFAGSAWHEGTNTDMDGCHLLQAAHLAAFLASDQPTPPASLISVFGEQEIAVVRWAVREQSSKLGVDPATDMARTACSLFARSGAGQTELDAAWAAYGDIATFPPGAKEVFFRANHSERAAGLCRIREEIRNSDLASPRTFLQRTRMVFSKTSELAAEGEARAKHPFDPFSKLNAAASDRSPLRGNGDVKERISALLESNADRLIARPADFVALRSFYHVLCAETLDDGTGNNPYRDAALKCPETASDYDNVAATCARIPLAERAGVMEGCRDLLQRCIEKDEKIAEEKGTPSLRETFGDPEPDGANLAPLDGFLSGKKEVEKKSKYYWIADEKSGEIKRVAKASFLEGMSVALKEFEEDAASGNPMKLIGGAAGTTLRNFLTTIRDGVVSMSMGESAFGAKKGWVSEHQHSRFNAFRHVEEAVQGSMRHNRSMPGELDRIASALQGAARQQSAVGGQ